MASSVTHRTTAAAAAATPTPTSRITDRNDPAYAPERKPFSPGSMGGVLGILAAVVRTVGMYTYFFVTVSVLWLLLPVILLHPLCRSLGVHARNLPYDIVLRYWNRLGLLVAGITADVDVHPDVWKIDNCVLVANHSSSLDGFSIVGYVPFGAKWIFKRELLWQVPYFFGLGYFTGSIAIDRSRGSSAFESINRAIPKLIKDKRTIAFFPEGTRSKTGTLLPFKKGAFHVARQMKVPVAPVILPSNYDLFPVTKWYALPGVIKIRCLKPIPYSEDDTVDSLMAKARRAMVDALENESFRTPVRNPFLGSIPAAIWLVILYFAVGYVKSLIW